MMRFLALIGLLAILGAIGAAVYFLGGYYSVACTAEDPAIVKWALMKVRTQSIKRHAVDKPPTPIDDPALVKAGARAFLVRGCVNCHGAPGVEWAEPTRSGIKSGARPLLRRQGALLFALHLLPSGRSEAPEPR